MASAARFAPLGSRSFGGRRIIDLYGRDYVHIANQRQLLIAQIETPQAVQCAEQIAAVDGIDILFFGPDDIRVCLQLPMDAPLTAAATRDAVGRTASQRAVVSMAIQILCRRRALHRTQRTQHLL